MLIEARVSFEKPKLDRLDTGEYSYIDMHTHSKYSDSFTKVKDIVNRAERFGLGIAITDHNDMRGCLDAMELKNKATMLIPGIEMSCREGIHLLTYFYSIHDLVDFYTNHVMPHKNKVPNMPLSATTGQLIDAASGYNCVIGVAHPFGMPRYNLKKHIEKGRVPGSVMESINFIEVFCGQNLRHMNIKAVEWAGAIKKGITGGSDGHVLREMGHVLTYSKANDPDSFLRDIIKGNNFVAGHETGISARIAPWPRQFSKSFMKHPIHSVRAQYNVSVQQHVDKLKSRVKSRINSRKGPRSLVR